MRPISEIALNQIASSQNSNPIPTQFGIAGSLQAVATGTIAGTVKLQFSNDKVQDQSQIQNWNDIPSATVTLTGTAGPFAIPKTDICYEWVRVVFTQSGGTGTVTATFKGYAF